ncbi:MAG: polysaccharide deacetylase family protein, partial [Microlunatus sp.]|nr:polysaccharide deacetylase family protein [Microlunatus sp.]
MSSKILAAAVAAGLVAVGGRMSFGSRSQVFGPFPYEGRTGRWELALTFDDGPNEPWTSMILDTLGEHNVPGTFFQVGRCAERHPATTRRVVEEGHVLGNHSYSHRLGSYLRDPDATSEVILGRTVLAEIAGVAPRLYRPPWLCHWPWVLR